MPHNLYLRQNVVYMLASKYMFQILVLPYNTVFFNLYYLPGAFLVPYFLSLAFAGMPLFFLEMNFGQYCSLGMLTCWRALPIMKGLQA